MTKRSPYIRDANETAAIFDIKSSTLRKYCIALEKAGYQFPKNSRGYRVFTQDDVTLLQRFITTKNSPGMTIEQAIKVVMDMQTDEAEQLGVMDSGTENNNHIDSMTKEEMREFIKAQLEFNKEIVKRLDEQKEREEEREKRVEERDKKLMETLQEVKETKRLIAAEKEAETTTNKKWWKFW